MYEDYLETFVFKTAKLIAMKLFGRVRKSKNEEAEAEPTSKETETEIKEDQEEKPEDKQVAEINDEDIDEKAVETDKLLDEVMKQQQEEKAKRDKELAAARVEYDEISEGMSEMNFHLPLFFLLLVITLLSAPSVVTWAKNYHYSRVLTPDPTLIPAVCILAALSVIWQMKTPRDL